MFVELVLPKLCFYVQGSAICLNRVKHDSYALHFPELEKKSIIKVMNAEALAKFLPLLFFEKNLSNIALRSPVKSQGERDFANHPVAGAGLMFAFDNDQNITIVSIICQRIPLSGLLHSRNIFFIENESLSNLPVKCEGVVIAYCSSRHLKCNQYTEALECIWHLGVIIAHSSTLTIIKKIRSIIVSIITLIFQPNSNV